MTPAISVIIPVHNGERFIAQAVQSVLDQEYPAHEIIVIDDGSTDNTPSVLEKFKDKIITRRTSNLGVSNARNTGLEAATGDYIAFLDADDVWFRNKLKVQVEAIRKYPEVGLFACNYEVFHAHLNKMVDHFLTFRSLKDINFDVSLKCNAFGLLVQRIYIGTASVVVLKKEVSDRVGLFTPEYTTAQDVDYWLRCATITPVLVQSDVLCHKRTHAKNATTDQLRNYQFRMKVFQDAFATQYRYIQEHGLTGTCKRALAKTNYAIGNLHFKAGNTKEAFRFYLDGLRCAATPGNALEFAQIVLKKTVRVMLSR